MAVHVMPREIDDPGDHDEADIDRKEQRFSLPINPFISDAGDSPYKDPHGRDQQKRLQISNLKHKLPLYAFSAPSVSPAYYTP